MSTFIDTSALYAVLDRDDTNHDAARAIWFRLLDTAEPLLTHNYVLLESIAIIQKRLGMDAVRAFLYDVSPLVSVTWIGPETHARALSALLMTDRRGLSLTDCASFEVMRDSGTRSVFAFDSHFTEQGFTLLTR